MTKQQLNNNGDKIMTTAKLTIKQEELMERLLNEGKIIEVYDGRIRTAKALARKGLVHTSSRIEFQGKTYGGGYGSGTIVMTPSVYKKAILGYAIEDRHPLNIAKYCRLADA